MNTQEIFLAIYKGLNEGLDFEDSDIKIVKKHINTDTINKNRWFLSLTSHDLQTIIFKQVNRSVLSGFKVIRESNDNLYLAKTNYSNSIQKVPNYFSSNHWKIIKTGSEYEQYYKQRFVYKLTPEQICNSSWFHDYIDGCPEFDKKNLHIYGKSAADITPDDIEYTMMNMIGDYRDVLEETLIKIYALYPDMKIHYLYFSPDKKLFFIEFFNKFVRYAYIGLTSLCAFEKLDNNIDIKAIKKFKDTMKQEGLIIPSCFKTDIFNDVSCLTYVFEGRLDSNAKWADIVRSYCPKQLNNFLKPTSNWLSVEKAAVNNVLESKDPAYKLRIIMVDSDYIDGNNNYIIVIYENITIKGPNSFKYKMVIYDNSEEQIIDKDIIADNLTILQ